MPKPTFDALLDEVVFHAHDGEYTTSTPSLTRNGQWSIAYIGGEGRIYFRSNDTSYYLTGLLVPSGTPVPNQLIGLLGAYTYA
jgi:hypothetical protein